LTGQPCVTRILLSFHCGWKLSLSALSYRHAYNLVPGCHGEYLAPGTRYLVPKATHGTRGTPVPGTLEGVRVDPCPVALNRNLEPIVPVCS